MISQCQMYKNLECYTKCSEVSHDHYVVAVACMELGMVYIEQGMLDLAERRLHRAKSDNTGYHMESRIHFRIHAALSQIANTPENPSVCSAMTSIFLVLYIHSKAKLDHMVMNSFLIYRSHKHIPA